MAVRGVKNMTNKKHVCVVCGSPATIFVSFVKNGGISKLCYCEKHAKEAGVINGHYYDFLPDNNCAAFEQITRCNVCPKCNMSQTAFLADKKFGCPNCYNVFYDFSSKLIQRIYEEPFHIGKVPKHFFKKHVVKERLNYFNKKMEALLARENYEQAAVLRDKIKFLKNKVRCIN